MKEMLRIAVALTIFLTVTIVGVPVPGAETTDETGSTPPTSSSKPGDHSRDQGYRPPPPPDGGPVMRVLDVNRDGVLSADEIAAASVNLLKLDTDGDGVVSNDELRPCPPPHER